MTLRSTPRDPLADGPSCFRPSRPSSPPRNLVHGVRPSVDPKLLDRGHIDHGKSTLADQLLLQSGAITQRELREQLLDDMDLERERGITIKARAVAINYTLDGKLYELNLIDTPGPRGFPLRGLAQPRRVRGGDAPGRRVSRGQAQTVANAYAAIKQRQLTIVPALNKIDMQARASRRDQGGDRDHAGDRSARTCWPSAARPARGSRPLPS